MGHDGWFTHQNWCFSIVTLIHQRVWKGLGLIDPCKGWIRMQQIWEVCPGFIQNMSSVAAKSSLWIGACTGFDGSEMVQKKPGNPAAFWVGQVGRGWTAWDWSKTYRTYHLVQELEVIADRRDFPIGQMGSWRVKGKSMKIRIRMVWCPLGPPFG